MRSVGLKVLKNKLSEYVRIAEAGETVLVTDRDRVVAELHPASVGRLVSVDDAHLAQAVRDGLLTAPVLKTGRPPARAPIASRSAILGELTADRSER